MTCRLARSRLPILLASAVCLLLPAAADAHLPAIGLGPVYDGVFHLFLSPEDLIPVIALALLCGQRGAPFGRRALWLVPLAWFTGGMLGMFWGSGRGSALTCVSFLAVGGLVAANARISLRVLTVVAMLLGCFHGYLNGAGINRFDDGTYALLGLALAVFVVVALFTSLVVPLRQQWTRVAVRVAGSWIAASGLLMLGWTLHSAR
jgi:hydrogenase/urease accessory protein HupE